MHPFQRAGASAEAESWSFQPCGRCTQLVAATSNPVRAATLGSERNEQIAVARLADFKGAETVNYPGAVNVP